MVIQGGLRPGSAPPMGRYREGPCWTSLLTPHPAAIATAPPAADRRRGRRCRRRPETPRAPAAGPPPFPGLRRRSPLPSEYASRAAPPRRRRRGNTPHIRKAEVIAYEDLGMEA